MNLFLPPPRPLGSSATTRTRPRAPHIPRPAPAGRGWTRAAGPGEGSNGNSFETRRRAILTFLCGLFALAGLALVPSARAADAPAAPASKGPLPIADLKRDSAVDFEKEVLPVFRNNCLACHNTTKAKAGLNLETPQLILKGGDNGPAVVPGKSADSLVFKAAAHLDPEVIMPPKDNKANAANFNPNELALLRLWIEQGAKGEVHTATAVNWLDHPAPLDPIFALDVTADGQFTACSRGNRVDVYHVPSGRHVARLTDPHSADWGLTNAAHRDLVNAVAFHPNGDLLATAGYRDVKLWRRAPVAPDRTVTNTATFFVVSPDRRWLATTGPGPDHSVRLLDLANNSAPRVLPGSTNALSAPAFSLDSRQLACAAPDRTVRIWNIADASIAGETTVPSDPRALAWLPDHTRLALGFSDGSIAVGSLTNLADAKPWPGHTGAVTALAALPGTNRLVSAGLDGLAQIWDLGHNQSVATLTQQVAGAVAITALAVSPDGKRIATAGTNATVRLWEDAGRLIAELRGDRYADEAVAARDRALVIARADVAFQKKSLESAEGELKKAEARVAKATETNTVTEKVFLEKEKVMKVAADAKSAAEKALQDLLAEIQRVTEGYQKADLSSKEATTNAADAAIKAADAQVAADRAAAAKADADKIAADTASVASRTKAAIANVDAAKDTARRIADESSSVAEKSRAFADAVAADAGMKTQLAAEAKTAAAKAIEEVASRAFAAGQLKPAYDKLSAEAPERRKQATNNVNNTAKALTDSQNELKRAETRKSVTGHELELANAAHTRSSNTVAATRTVVAAAETAQTQATTALEHAKKHAANSTVPALALAFSPDSHTLAALATDGHALTWNADSGAAYDVLPRRTPSADVHPPASQPAGLAFLDDDHLLAPATAQAGTALAWNLHPAWALATTLGSSDAEPLFADRVNAVRFSPDGTLLATGGGEPTRSGEIKLFRISSGPTNSLVRSLADVHSDAVLSLDFSPDGKFLASSSADRFVKVVDLANGKVAKAFEGHTSYVLGVAWKRDSRTLASAGADKVIKVWDFVTGDRRKNIEGADKDVTGVTFVGISDQLVATSGDSQVRLLKENGEKVRSFEGAADFMNSTAATPDGRVVVAGGQDGRLLIWNGTDGRKMATFAPAD